MLSRPASLPSQSHISRDQLSIYSDFVLPRRHRLLEELAALRSEMGVKLDLPTSDEPIHVYLFDKADSYNQYIVANYPRFPERRAFFIETDTRLTVYAYWGDRVAEDLRHELAHGYLHAVTPGVPLWLDEGIAEYYETPRSQQGRHRWHIELLSNRYRERAWLPDLQRLESLTDVAQMSQIDYAEAWLWTHFLLDTSRSRLALVQTYLAGLRRSATAPPFSQVLGTAEVLPAEPVSQHLVWLRNEMDRQ